jgi:hypothetical protein
MRSICTAAISDTKHRSAIVISGFSRIASACSPICRSCSSAVEWSQKNQGE